MGLRNDIVWVEPNFVITKESRERYQPIRQRDMVAVVPVAALRACLIGRVVEGCLCAECALGRDLLAELEEDA